MHSKKEIDSWNLGRPGSALIQSFDEFVGYRNCMPGEIIMTSGGFDPIHPGHLTSFMDAANFVRKRARDGNLPAPQLVVVVNGDQFLSNKKGRPFIDLKTRCQIVSACKDVDVVIPFEADDDMTVVNAIRHIRPHFFAKGGDRTGIENIPEWDICQKVDTEILTGMGDDKLWSSSDLLARWEKPHRDYIEHLEAGGD